MNIREFERELKRIDEDIEVVFYPASEKYEIKDHCFVYLDFDIKRNWCLINLDRVQVNFSKKTYQVLELFAKFMQTSPDERVEQKKYYLRHRWLIYKNYLNYWIGTNKYWLEDKNETIEARTQFTQKEIDEIKKRFNTDLSDFEQIEAED